MADDPGGESEGEVVEEQGEWIGIGDVVENDAKEDGGSVEEVREENEEEEYEEREEGGRKLEGSVEGSMEGSREEVEADWE